MSAPANQLATPSRATGSRTPLRAAAIVTPPVSGAGILDAVGNTPLVALDRLFAAADFQVFAKIEGLNPGGSIKDRTALGILRHGIDSGAIVPGVTTVVESTSGNLGIALAQFCAVLGVDLVLVTDPKVTPQNLALLRAYGASVDVVTDRDPATGEYLPVRLERVKELLASTAHSYWPNQYASLSGAAAHRTTMAEIWTAMNGRVDYLFATAGTCGTLRGCVDFLAERRAETRADTVVIAVDAVGSAIFDTTPPPVARRIPGHGAAIAPALRPDGLAGRVQYITDQECVAGCYALRDHESILAGGSSGAAVAGIAKYAAAIRPGSTVAVILPDRGDRYLDTIFCPSWVADALGRPDANLRFPTHPRPRHSDRPKEKVA